MGRGGLEFHYRPRDSEEPTKPPLKISMGCGGWRSVRSVGEERLDVEEDFRDLDRKCRGKSNPRG